MFADAEGGIEKCVEHCGLSHALTRAREIMWGYASRNVDATRHVSSVVSFAFWRFRASRIVHAAIPLVCMYTLDYPFACVLLCAVSIPTHTHRPSHSMHARESPIAFSKARACICMRRGNCQFFANSISVLFSHAPPPSSTPAGAVMHQRRFFIRLTAAIAARASISWPF